MRLAVPTALAAIGEAVSERAGVFNLGLEGMMMVGAFTGFAVASRSGSEALGVLAGGVGGAALASLMVVGAVWRGTNVIVTGFALVLLGQGLANLFYAQNQDPLTTFEPLGELAPRPPVPLPVARRRAVRTERPRLRDRGARRGCRAGAVPYAGRARGRRVRC